MTQKKPEQPRGCKKLLAGRGKAHSGIKHTCSRKCQEVEQHSLDGMTPCTMEAEQLTFTFSFFKRLYSFLERGRKGEREGEEHQCVVASHTSPATGGLDRNPGMYPAWESNCNALVHSPMLSPLRHTSQG